MVSVHGGIRRGRDGSRSRRRGQGRDGADKDGEGLSPGERERELKVGADADGDVGHLPAKGSGSPAGDGVPVGAPAPAAVHRAAPAPPEVAGAWASSQPAGGSCRGGPAAAVPRRVFGARGALRSPAVRVNAGGGGGGGGGGGRGGHKRQLVSVPVGRRLIGMDGAAGARPMLWRSGSTRLLHKL